MPSSPMFCTPRGTSLGLANAAQKNAITSTPLTTISRSGQVKLNEPIVKRGRNVKLSGYVGAGYPQPEPRWHPPATGAGDIKVTLDSLNVCVAWAASAAAAGHRACAAVAPGSVGQDRPYR